jgi:hypothetical protein
MSFFVAMLLISAQAPAAQQPAPPAQSAQSTQPAAKKKPKQNCQFMEVTGSRTRQRICHDQFGELDLGPGVSNEAPNAGMMHSIPGAAKGGVGGTPQ